MSFNSRIILNFFCTFLVLKLQNRQKDLGSNGHLSKFGLIRVLEIVLDFDPEILSFKTRKVKDYPCVQPQDNSALGQINVTLQFQMSDVLAYTLVTLGSSAFSSSLALVVLRTWLSTFIVTYLRTKIQQTKMLVTF